MEAVVERSAVERIAAGDRAGDRLESHVGAISVAFGAAYLVLIVAPPFLPAPLASYPLLRVGDVVDLFAPLVLIPLSWLLFRVAAREPPSVAAIGAFLALAVVWVQGQGMHLAANAIGHLAGSEGDDLSALVLYLDEVLSHQLWHGAVFGLAALTMRRAWRSAGEPGMSPMSLAAVLVGGFLFGATLFTMVVEGVTWPFGLPAAAILAIAGLLATHGRPTARPVVALFVLAFVVTLALSASWAALNGWQLVEFSKVFGF